MTRLKESLQAWQDDEAPSVVYTSSTPPGRKYSVPRPEAAGSTKTLRKRTQRDIASDDDSAGPSKRTRSGRVHMAGPAMEDGRTACGMQQHVRDVLESLVVRDLSGLKKRPKVEADDQPDPLLREWRLVFDNVHGIMERVEDETGRKRCALFRRLPSKKASSSWDDTLGRFDSLFGRLTRTTRP